MYKRILENLYEILLAHVRQFLQNLSRISPNNIIDITRINHKFNQVKLGTINRKIN